MTYSNKLALDQFFSAVQEQIYVVVKLSDFPNYYTGSDIDIFCYDKESFAQAILDIGNQYAQQGFEIQVTHKQADQTYIDFFLDDVLEFRFDLYGALPHYKKIRLKKQYLFSVIENATIIYREYKTETYPLFVPAPVDDTLLRYIEYIEWYETRPDKIKHLDYIMASLADDSGRIKFLDKLHVYTALPTPHYDNAPAKRFHALQRLAHWSRIARTIPLSKLPGKIYGKLKRKFLH